MISLASKVLLPGAIPDLLLGAGVIDESTVLPMTVVVAIGGACWYLNGRLTRIEGRIDHLQRLIEPKNHQSNETD
jgi:hypothetical protein